MSFAPRSLTPRAPRRKLRSPRGHSPGRLSNGNNERRRSTSLANLAEKPQSASARKLPVEQWPDPAVDAGRAPKVSFGANIFAPDPVYNQSNFEHRNFSKTKLAPTDLSETGTLGETYEVLVLSRVPGIQERIKQLLFFDQYNVIYAKDKGLLTMGIIRKVATAVADEVNQDLLDEEEEDVDTEAGSANPTMVDFGGNPKEKKISSRMSLVDRQTDLINKRKKKKKGKGKRRPTSGKKAWDVSSVATMQETLVPTEKKDDNKQEEEEEEEEEERPINRIVLPAQTFIEVDGAPAENGEATKERVYLSMCIPGNLDDAKDVLVSVTRAHIIIADPDLIVPYIYETPCLKWLHSTWSGVEHIVSSIRRVKVHHAEQGESYQQLLDKATAEKKIVDEKQLALQAKFEDQSPLLKEATDLVKAIGKSDLDNLRSLKRPPEAAKLCLETAIAFLKFPTPKNYNEMLRLVTDAAFGARVMAFDPFDMDSQQKAVVEKMINSKDFSFEKMDRAYQACGSLARWMSAQLKLYETSVVLKPMVVELKGLKAAYAAREQEVKDFEDKLAIYDEELRFPLTRTAGVFGPHVAEYCVAQIISRERHFNMVQEAQRNKEWIKDYSYRPLYSLTIGIMGAGEIGSSVAKMLKTLGSKVKAIVRQNRHSTAVPDVDETLVFADDGNDETKREVLQKFLTGCDYVINCLPSTPLTVGLLNGDALNVCNNTVLINVGRGDIISDESLLSALQNKWLVGAVLDVFATEPLPSDHPFWEHPQIVVTSHVSGRSFAHSVSDLFVKNLNSFVRHQNLENVVEINKGY